MSTTSPASTSHPSTAPADFSLRLHPDGGLYAGDQVSLELIAPAGMDMNKKTVKLFVDGSSDPAASPAEFHPSALPNHWQATLAWAWDTTGLSPGQHTLSFIIFPDNHAWSQTVTLQPASDQPPPGQNARWETTQTSCCVIHTISGTAAQRDLAELIDIANTQAQQVTAKFHTHLSTLIPITFLPRTLGQGGFTADEIEVSYLDRDYAGSTVAQVLHHEMVHFVDGKLGGDLRPTMLLEGLAVYLSGGHFKPESLPLQVRALLDLNDYIPLPLLADNFYGSQHEIGYLEGGAFIQYLVDRQGWEAFSAFYRDIHPQPNGSQAAAIDAALKVHYGLTFRQAEDGFIGSLLRQPDLPEMRTDVTLSITFYDTMRRYQQLLDPSAYFREVWLPNVGEMMKRGIVADYLRHPDAPLNQALEALMISAEKDLRQGRYAEAERALSAVTLSLNQVERQAQSPTEADPLSENYLALTLALDRCGLEPQQFQLDQTSSIALAIPLSRWPELEKIPLTETSGEWRLAQPCAAP